MTKKINAHLEGRDPRTGLLRGEDLTHKVLSTFNECAVKFDVQTKGRIPYSVILFDVDYFKAINDIMGYSYGNTALRGIGEVLQNLESRKEFVGVLGRYGGEEFLIALPYSQTRRAKYIADEVREIIENYSFLDPKTQKRSLKKFITASFGVSTANIADLMEKIKDIPEEKRKDELHKIFAELMETSTCALEYAKFMGKNRVDVFSRYLEQEMRNLNKIRNFYFLNSSKMPRELKDVFGSGYCKKNPDIASRIKKHFKIIRKEINLRDTRTQALFADNLYRLVSEKADKREFLEFIQKFY